MKQNKIPRNEYIRKPVGKTDPYTDDVVYGKLGQYTAPGQVTRIPGDAYGTPITMNGVPYPVYGEDNLGYSQMMYPGMDYQFPGQYVTEYPMAAYGGDPSLPALTGHYPFGGMYTKTHTHFKRGGWLDQLQNGGGPNLGIDPPPMRTASNVGAVNEDELFDQYKQLMEQLEQEKKQVSKVRGNLMPVAKALDEADSKILADKESAAYKAFIKSRYASTPEELKKAIQEYPEELKNVLPGRGSYNIALADPKKYKAHDELYCTPYGCFTYQKAGAKDVPIVAGNFGFVGGVKEGKLPFKKVSASEAEPGDMAIVYGLQPADYRGDPTAEWVDRPHHTTVLAGKPTFDKKGKVTGFSMYNADEGNRLNYEKAYRDAAARKDTGYEFYRYVGQTPKYEEQLENIKAKLASLPIESMPIKAQYILPQEEPELELRQTGGRFIINNTDYDTVAETSGVYKRKIPSLDTLKRQAEKQAARPWDQWSPEEKERYIKNPPKKMTPAQAEEWNKRAEQWSSAQAKKENTEDYIRESTKKAVLENPAWNATVSFTPAGMIGSLMKGAINAGPDVYKTIKNPTSAINYANIADDILSMAHIPESAIGFKSLAKIKKMGVPGTNQGITVGDVKKLYSTEKKFQKKEEPTANRTHPSGMTDAQISSHINKFLNPLGQMEEGGWLDEYFRGGSGPMTPPGLKKKVRQHGTSKNIQSSINKLFLRNQDLFGPSGKNIYNPKSKYQSGGGWLDNLD